MFYLVSFEPNWNLQNYDRLFLPRHSLNSSWHVSLPDHVFYSPIEYYPNYVWLYRDCFYRIIKTMDSESPDRLVLLVLFPSSNSHYIGFLHRKWVWWGQRKQRHLQHRNLQIGFIDGAFTLMSTLRWLSKNLGLRLTAPV